MADRTGIEWCDATWNPITGCSVVSAGCKNCYAMRLAGTRMRHHPSRAELTLMTKAGPVWTGLVRLNESWLEQPLRWKKPRRIFVCAHGDLFHENVQEAWIASVFAVMALAPQHTFLVLTKRPRFMSKFLTVNGRRDQIESIAFQYLETVAGRDRAENWYRADPPWPLPNVWLGVSVENQAAADERIPLLLATPAAKRFISAEPLLGPIDLDAVPVTAAPGFFGGALRWHHRGKCHEDDGAPYPALDWVIAGGESGPGARPMHPDWPRSLRDQCAAAGVPFFFKQWGEWLPVAPIGDDDACDLIADYTCELTSGDIWTDDRRMRLIDRAGCDWVNDQAQPPPDAWALHRIGKKAAGTLLDGRRHKEWPA